MVEAFILVNAEFDLSQKQILENLQEIDYVDEVYSIAYGVYDFIAEVQTETVDELKNSVLESIHNLDAVDSATTLIVNKE
jgi:DNA-binding Lrp family transcriptional regulator